MIVNEKGLIRALKEERQNKGYTVAVDDAPGGDEVILVGRTWAVAIDRDKLPRKVLGMIAEHVGEIPKVGTAYRVMKKECQTEIFEEVMGTIPGARAGDGPVSGFRRTPLVLAGYPLWQTVDGLRVVKVAPGDEEILDLGTGLAHLVKDKLLMARGSESRAYITCEAAITEQERKWIEHLEKTRWVAG